MKTTDIILIGGLALGGYWLITQSGKKAEAVTLPGLGGGGGGGFDLSGFLAGLSLGGGGGSQGGGGFDLSGILGGFQSSLAGMLGNLQGTQQGFAISWDALQGLLGLNKVNLPGGGDVIVGAVKDVINPFKGLGDPWAGVGDPYKNINKNIASAVQSVGTILESGSMVPRVVAGAVGNAMSGNVWGGHALGILSPGIAVISGAIREMREIATEKNPYMQYTAQAGPGTRATGNVEAAAIRAQIASGVRDSAGNPVATTPQHSAMANEVALGKSPEAPSRGESGWIQATRAMPGGIYA